MKNTFVYLIKLYQRYFSPIKGTKCPYYPSCSEYGIEAIERYGAFLGGIISVYRIIRCNPFSKGGVDPVPDINGENYHKLLIRRKS